MNIPEAQWKLAQILTPLSRAYAGLMRLRAWSYAKGLQKSALPQAPCISVGNISWGGSGKTPLVDWLLSWAESKSLRPAVLTRGYGGKSEDRPLQVTPATPAAQSGDEALMLAKAHPEALILADPVRRRALAWAAKNAKTDLFILDDGMQHLALRRNINLVVLKIEDLLEAWDKVIPAGNWREGKEALGRADAFMLRAAPGIALGIEETIRKRLLPFQKTSAANPVRNIPVFSFDLRPQGLAPLHKAENGASFGESAYAVCTAVGNPESVLSGAARLLGRVPEKTFVYRDHHQFTTEDLRKMFRANLPLVITAKDAVKIQPFLKDVPEPQCFVMQSAVEFGPSFFTDTDFGSWLAGAMANCGQELFLLP